MRRHPTPLPWLVVVFLSTIAVTPAQAYIDPNTGGMLFQLLFPLFAVLLAFWAFVRNRLADAWRWILLILGLRPGR